MHAFISILQLLGAIALFVLAIKYLSENLQALSGSNFKSTLSKLTKNNLSTIFTGTVFTTAIQSSSAASVFILSFVNAGFINLKKAFGLILGANIGTTITLWLVYLGMKFDLIEIALPLIFIAFPFYLSKKRNKRNIGKIFFYLALLFFALSFLKKIIPSIEEYQEVQFLFQNLPQQNLLTNIFYIIIGIIFTILLHFSSASITVAVLLTSKGLSIDIATMIILGANIGTTFTSHIVAAIGDQSTRIVASFHTFFNVIITIVFLFLGKYLLLFINDNISTNSSIKLIAFNAIINISGVFIFYPFINSIATFCEKNFFSINVKGKRGKYNILPFVNSSDLYKNETNKQLLKLATTTKQTIHTLGRMITESDEEKIVIFRERIFELEKEGDFLEKEVNEFLNEIINLDLPNESTFSISKLLTLCHHLENVGDVAMRISLIHRERRITNSYFTPKMRLYLVNFQKNLDQSTRVLNQNLNEMHEKVYIDQADFIEKNINDIYKEAEDNLMKSIEKEKILTTSALFYKDLIQSYKILGSHLYKANKTIVELKNRQ